MPQGCHSAWGSHISTSYVSCILILSLWLPQLWREALQKPTGGKSLPSWSLTFVLQCGSSYITPLNVSKVTVAGGHDWLLLHASYCIAYNITDINKFSHMVEQLSRFSTLAAIKLEHISECAIHLKHRLWGLRMSIYHLFPHDTNATELEITLYKSWLYTK